MKAINQKEHTVEIIKFAGIVLAVMTFMGFTFFGGTSHLPKEEKAQLQERIASLEAQIEVYELRDKSISAVLFYADSVNKLMERLNESEKGLLTVKSQPSNFFTDGEVIRLTGEINNILIDIRGAQARLSEGKYLEGMPFVPSSHVERVASNLTKSLAMVISEKDYKRGQILSKEENNSEVERLQQMIEQQQQQLDQKSLENAFQTQLSQKDTELKSSGDNLKDCQANLTVMQGLVAQSKSLLSTGGPLTQTYSTDIKSYTTRLNGVLNDMVISNKNETIIKELIGNYNGVATKILDLSGQMNTLNANLK